MVNFIKNILLQHYSQYCYSDLLKQTGNCFDASWSLQCLEVVYIKYFKNRASSQVSKSFTSAIANCVIVSKRLTTLGLKMLASLTFSLVTNLMPQATWYGVVFQDSPSINFPSGSMILMGLLSFAAFSASRASCSAFSLLYIDRRPSMYCGGGLNYRWERQTHYTNSVHCFKSPSQCMYHK